MRLILMSLLLSASVGARADFSYQGEARDPESGALLYEEHHLLRRDGDRPLERRVLYRCPDGRAFARKRVQYAGSGRAPLFELVDERAGYREGTRATNGGIEAFVQTPREREERRATLDAGAALVVDAGFDEFVRSQWEALQQGETVRLDFLVPSRLDTYGFTLKRVGRVGEGEAAASVFRLSLGGLVGLFAPDIEVRYRDADRRLMRFEGVTNIRTEGEDNLVARIDFPVARERAGVDAEAWDAALREPLVDCPSGG